MVRGIKRTLGLWSLVLISAAIAQEIPNHVVPIGKGSGVIGYGSLGTCSSGVPFVGNGASADPGCGAGAAVTGSGLTANQPVIGAGGSAVAIGTKSGNTTTFATTSGSLPNTHLGAFDTNGNIVDGGTASPVINIRDPIYGAKCNYNVLADGAMGSGSTTLSSASAAFTSADVGKLIQVAGAGASGAVLGTTIASFTDGTHVVLTAGNTSGGAVSSKFVEYGTDDTTAINNAIAAGVSTGRPVYHPTGSCMVKTINATGTNHLTYYGDGINQSILYEWAGTAALNTATWHVFDLTGSSFVTLSRFQIGSFQTLAQPTTGIFIAQVASNVSTRFIIDEIYVSGQYSVSALYDYGVPSWRISGSDFYNYFPGAGTQDVARFTATNQATLSSSFATVTSGTKSTSDIHFFNVEMHKFAGAGANNDCVLLDGVANIGWYGGVISGGCAEYIQFTGAVTNVSWLNTTFETESQPVTPTNAFLLANASTLNGVTTLQSSYILGSNVWNAAGTGSLQTIKSGLTFDGTTTAAIAQNTTVYLGLGCQDTSAAANCAKTFPISTTATNLQVNTTASPGGGQSYIIALMINNVASGSTCTISASATACTFQGGPTNIPQGGQVAYRVISSATAASTRLNATIELIAN